MQAWLEELTREGSVITDGAWGTQMQARGLPAGACPDSWNLIRPEVVTAVAQDYVNAGSQVILTNTFRCNRLTLAEYGLAEQTGALNRAGVALSREAAGGRARVFASIGPTGKLLMLGGVDEEALRAAFAEQALALAEGGAEALVVETMTDLVEAAIAVRAAAGTGLPVVASMVFDSGKNHDRTLMGVTPEQAAASLEAAGAAVIGANCGLGLAGYLPICERLHAATSLPIWIKANAGLPTLVDGRAEYRETAESFAALVPAVAAAGASFIGGCCGTTPAYIAAARARLGR